VQRAAQRGRGVLTPIFGGRSPLVHGLGAPRQADRVAEERPLREKRRSALSGLRETASTRKRNAFAEAVAVALLSSRGPRSMSNSPRIEAVAKLSPAARVARTRFLRDQIGRAPLPQRLRSPHTRPVWAGSRTLGFATASIRWTIRHDRRRDREWARGGSPPPGTDAGRRARRRARAPRLREKRHSVSGAPRRAGSQRQWSWHLSDAVRQPMCHDSTESAASRRQGRSRTAVARRTARRRTRSSPGGVVG